MSKLQPTSSILQYHLHQLLESTNVTKTISNMVMLYIFFFFQSTKRASLKWIKIQNYFYYEIQQVTLFHRWGSQRPFFFFLFFRYQCFQILIIAEVFITMHTNKLPERLLFRKSVSKYIEMYDSVTPVGCEI